MRKAISITLDPETIEKIDAAKDRNVPRSRFIEDIIFGFLEYDNGAELTSATIRVTPTTPYNKGEDV
tara:strand:+ start:345 stop:545 length:201 start_codon:yes stop_codon:yes gene_type:complete